MWEDTSRPEELINSHVKLLAGAREITSGLGVLALLWSTVVLLGGFVSLLPLKEFWILTALSFLMACKVAKNADEFVKGIYGEEAIIIDLLDEHEHIIKAPKKKILLKVAVAVKMVFLVCFWLLYYYAPAAGLWISVWRLVQQEYGDADGDTANGAKLTAALNVFYALVMLQSLFGLYYLAISVSHVTPSARNPDCGFKWGEQALGEYRSETERKFARDGELPKGWNLITYGVESLWSASGDDHLWGARVLDQLLDKDTDVIREKLLSSRLSVQNLIGMVIAGRGRTDDDDIEKRAQNNLLCVVRRCRTNDDIEKRERAARILARLANDLNITQFPGTVECICCLLERLNKQFCDSLVVTCPSENGNRLAHRHRADRKDDQQGPLETSNHQNNAHVVVPVKDDQTGPRTIEPITQGLLILEKLTRDDHEGNCTEISKDQRLLSKITAPLLHINIRNVYHKRMYLFLNFSITVLSRLLKIPGDGATRLCQELASNTEAVSNLMAILENNSEGAQELHEQALEILIELALASFTKSAFVESAFMVNKLCENLEIFLEEKDVNHIAAEPDREKALGLSRVRVKAGDALQRLLPFQSARIVRAAAKISKKDAIDRLTKLVDRTLSGNIGTTAEAATRAGSSNSCATQKVGSQPLEEAVSVQPPTQGNAEQYEGRDINVISKQAFMEDMLFIAAAMRVVNVTSEQDFTRPSPEDEALVKKAMEILEVNKRSTAEFFRTLKVTCQVVVPMIQAVPSCIKYLNEQNFKETMIEILETMNDRELPKFDAARVKKMKERTPVRQHKKRATSLSILLSCICFVSSTVLRIVFWARIVFV